MTGLKGSPRTSNDGIVYAGRTYYDSIGRIINDIEMTENDTEQHWMIKHNADTKEFTVQDLQSESGTFARLVKPFHLWNNCICSFGDSHVTLKIE